MYTALDFGKIKQVYFSECKFIKEALDIFKVISATS